MEIDNERLVKIYLKMRTAKSALTRAYEAEKAAIEAEMATVEGLLGMSLDRNKAKNMATTAGSFYAETVTHVSCNDWPAFHGWLLKEGDLDGLEKRVGKNFVVEYMKSHDGETPPGIATYKEQVVRVRVGND